MLVPLTPVILNQLKPGGIYITSGIIDEKESCVREAVEKAGLEILEVTYQGEWVSVTSRKTYWSWRREQWTKCRKWTCRKRRIRKVKYTGNKTYRKKIYSLQWKMWGNTDVSVFYRAFCRGKRDCWNYGTGCQSYKECTSYARRREDSGCKWNRRQEISVWDPEIGRGMYSVRNLIGGRGGYGTFL